MSGLGLVFSIAKDALAAQRYGMNVTAHNIANVNTEGYSRQRAVYEAKEPTPYGGVLLGRGVDTADIVRASDQLIENQLMQQKAGMYSFTEMENYMQVLEGLFNESSETSLSVMLSDYWNLWQDIANNPSGSSERIALYEHGILLLEQCSNLNTDLTQIETNLTNSISGGIVEINQITSEITQLNSRIVALEVVNIANDLRDRRNTLVSQLSEYLDVKTFEQNDGSLAIITVKGCMLVHGDDSYELAVGGEDGKRVQWQGSGGKTVDITDSLTRGKLGGWLSMRDEVIAKYKLDLDALTKEFIWAVNEQHSQGVGLQLFSVDVKGTYKTDSSGLLSTLTYGHKIDYTKDFRMWIDNGTSQNAVTVDMGISDAAATNWAGTAPGTTQCKYVFTVTTAGTVGADANVTETNGDGLGVVQRDIDVSTALDGAIAAQTITVTGGGGGDQTVSIADSGGDAIRSASSIADALNAIDGVTAYASSVRVDIGGITRADLDVSTGVPGSTSEGDELSFTLYAGSQTQTVSFLIGSDDSLQPHNVRTEDNFEAALQAAIDAINTNNGNNDLSLTGAGSSRTITSASGETIGIENMTYADNATVAIGAFAGSTSGDIVSFELADDDTGTNGITVSFIKGSNDTEDSQNLHAALIGGPNAAALATAGYTFRLDSVNHRVVITRSGEKDFAVANFRDAGGTDATATVSIQEAGTTLDGGGFLDEGGDDDVEATPFDDGNRKITFGEEDVTEGGVTDSAVITGTVTVLLKPGLSIRSDVAGATGGLFNVAAGADATVGKSIITLGGDGGFTGFDAGDTISFNIDGTVVTYTVGALDDTDLEFATGLEAALGVLGANYSVSSNGASVSIIKTDGTAIEITDFADTTNNATLTVNTGTGAGTADPANTLLDASAPNKTSATSRLYDSSGVISWEKFDITGASTGISGSINMADAGPFVVEGTMSFDIGAGALVAGNTFTINTDINRNPDPLSLALSGNANSISDTYKFTVISGGEIGRSETIEIRWSNSIASDTVTLESSAGYSVDVDGMTIRFTDGTLLDGNVFTITTDEHGSPTANLPSDWHWTLDSFKDQFNTQATGVTASVTSDNALRFSPDNGYSFGFCDHNFGDSGLLAALGINTFFEGDSARSIGINSQITNKDFITAGRINNNVGPAVRGSGDVSTVTTFGPYTGVADGTYNVEIVTSGNEAGATFRWNKDGGSWTTVDLGDGESATRTLSDGVTLTFNPGTYVAGSTYTIAVTASSDPSKLLARGDNTNAIAIADLQYESRTIAQWTCIRDHANSSGNVTTTLEGYYHSTVGSIGIKSASVSRSRAFNEVMTNELSETRDSISAVSLDEEMINLMKFQHAYTAAAKIISVCDEMLNTLLNVK